MIFQTIFDQINASFQKTKKPTNRKLLNGSCFFIFMYHLFIKT